MFLCMILFNQEDNFKTIDVAESLTNYAHGLQP